MHVQVDVALATVRAALDAEVFAEAFSMGQRMPLDEAFAMIMGIAVEGERGPHGDPLSGLWVQNALADVHH